MKFKKLDGKNITNNAIDTGSIVVGAALANGVEGLVANQDPTLVNGGMLIAGVVGSSLVDDKSTMGKVLKGIATGVAAKGGYDLIKSLISPSLPANDGTKANKFLHDMFQTGQTGLATSQNRMGGYRFVPKSTMASPYSTQTIRPQTTRGVSFVAA